MRSGFAALLVGSFMSLVDSTIALALEGAGPQVAGDVLIHVNAGSVSNLANGNGASGEINIGVISDAHVGGDVSVNVSLDDVSNTATGNGTRSCISIGVVGPGCLGR